jgi:hypothetical protein
MSTIVHELLIEFHNEPFFVRWDAAASLDELLSF